MYPTMQRVLGAFRHLSDTRRNKKKFRGLKNIQPTREQFHLKPSILRQDKKTVCVVFEIHYKQGLSIHEVATTTRRKIIKILTLASKLCFDDILFARDCFKDIKNIVIFTANIADR